MFLSKAESSYIQTSLVSNPPHRSDGRSLYDFRPIALETGVAPLANGSARLHIGTVGTEVLAAVKLDVEDEDDEEINENGRIVCSVSCSPSAYPHLSTPSLEFHQSTLTTLLHTTLSHPSLLPLSPSLSILPHRKAWRVSLDVLILSDDGGVEDAIFMVSRAALWDCRVPRTRVVQGRMVGGDRAPRTDDVHGMDVDDDGPKSHLDTRKMVQPASDFELPDYWDEGEVLGGRDRWPISVTLNMVPPVHYLDATATEEAATQLRLLLVFSFPSSGMPMLQATRLLGAGYIPLAQIKDLVKEGEKHAKELFVALDVKLTEEDVRRNQKEREIFARR